MIIHSKAKKNQQTLFLRSHNFKMLTKIAVTDCNPKNDMRKAECMKNFIASKMNCSTPWEENRANKRNCESVEDLQTYINLRLNIYSGKYDKELQDCLLLSCERRQWKTQKFVNYDDTAMKLLLPEIMQIKYDPDLFAVTFLQLSRKV